MQYVWIDITYQACFDVAKRLGFGRGVLFYRTNGRKQHDWEQHRGARGLFSRENRKEREVESHTRKSLTVKCCARFRHNTYFFVGIVRPGRRDYGPSQRPAPPAPGKTDTGLMAGAGGPTMRRSVRLQPPRHHGPSHGLTSRPLRGQSSRTRSRASSHPVRGDAPPAGRPASGAYPRTAGNGPSAPARMEDRRRATPIQSRQRNVPRHAHARRGRETERRTDAPPSFIFF